MEAAAAESPDEPTGPRQWPWALASPPVVSSDSGRWRGALLRTWRGTSPVMVQPPLNHHYVVMHLGGAKQVSRRLDGPPVCTVVASPSLTLVPAGAANVWNTQGPIAFAHLYLSPGQLRQAVCADFGGDGRSATLVDRVGCRDPWLERLLQRMIDEVTCGPDASPLLLDGLLDSVLCRLVSRHSPRASSRDARPLALAPHRLRRVLELIDAQLSEDLRLADLAAAAGSSQAHFSRAFHLATGSSPYHHVIKCRIERAKVLLLTGPEPLAAVAAACGFNSQHQFASMFKRVVGIGPKRFSKPRDRG